LPEKDNFIYIPSEQHATASNISRFMKKYGITGYAELVDRSTRDMEWYWNAINEDMGLEWFRKYDSVYDNPDQIYKTRWFLNGRCNIVSNAIDRHAKKTPDKLAYIFENEQGIETKVSYSDLDAKVTALAGALIDTGVRKGDAIGIYMPMIPEAFFAIFACSKIGAVHVTVFSGFGEQALHSRLVDSKAKLLITSDRISRRSTEIDLSKRWLKAIEGTYVSKVVVAAKDRDRVRDSLQNMQAKTGVDITTYEEFVGRGQGKDCMTEPMDSEDPLFILYTSGTTGQPKGTVQVHGGFTVIAAQQAAYLVDMRPDDTLFWYADIGWITGQTWVVYGSPIAGGTAVVYDGAVDYPAPDRWCDLIDRHRVTIFGIAPTAIRMFMKYNVEPSLHDLSSLRILATTGEPINKEAWMWYFEKVGNKKCPIINLSGGTEAGGAILSALPIMPLKPCTVGCPVPGFDADIFDELGNKVGEGEGYLVIKKPWPSMTRGLLNNHSKFIETYWSKFRGIWYHGDIVLLDSSGLWYMRGRADDVIKCSGHRIGTAEIESAIAAHHAVAEAVAVGVPDNLRGEAIVACVVLKESCTLDREVLEKEISSLVESAVGTFARPQIRFMADLPRTRTGKIIRRLVRSKIAGDDLSQEDLSSVDNPSSLESI
jgi:acetyl-CoA synthetase